jgi:hypothetical protein
MKQSKSNNILQKGIIIPLIFFGLVACKKEKSSSLNEVAMTTAASDIAAVKSVVGDRGNLFVLSSQGVGGAVDTEFNTSVNSLSSNIKPMSLIEFSKLFVSLTKDSLYATGIRIEKQQGDSVKLESNAIKVNDEWADDGPGPAGLYRFTFGPTNGNNPSFFSNLNLSFNSNSNGSINGTPSLYFSGLQLFGWQTQQTSLVSFNSSTLISTFAITGVATFGVQMGSGTTVGWGSNVTFYITINMDEYASKPVSIYANN